MIEALFEGPCCFVVEVARVREYNEVAGDIKGIQVCAKKVNVPAMDIGGRLGGLVAPI